MVGVLEDRVLPPPVIDLVGDDVGAAVDRFGDVRDLGVGQDDARRVGRRVDDEPLNFLAHNRLDLRGPEVEAVLLEDVDAPGHPVHELHDVRVARVARVREDDLVPRVQQRREDHHHRGRRAVGHDDVFRRDRQAVAVVVVLRDGRAQLWDTQAVRVVGHAALDGSASRVPHRPRGLEIGLAHLEVDDVGPFRLELVGFLEDLHGVERGEVGRPHRRQKLYLRDWSSVCVL